MTENHGRLSRLEIVTSTGGVATVAYSDAYSRPPQPPQTTVSLGDVPDHGLEATAAPITLAPGGSRTLGNVTLTCPSGGAACSVSVTETTDGSVIVTSTGGVATVAYSKAYSDNVASNPLVTKWQKFNAGNPTLAMTVNQALAKLNSIGRRETHGIYAPEYYVDDGAWHASEYAEISERPGYSDYVSEPITGLPQGVTLNPVLEHNGVSLIQVMYDLRDEHGDAPVVSCSEGEHDCVPDSQQSNVEYGRSIGELYWGFLDYSRFNLSRGRYCTGASTEACDDQQFAVWNHSADAESYGLYSATNPTGIGSATWTGIMTGLNLGSYEAPASGLVLGEATVDIDDLSNPDVDVSFTGIYDVSAGITHPDMHWSDLALTDGAFNDGAPRTISGAFYGPNQQEAGGVFDRDGIAGAFGARRTGSEQPAVRSDTAFAIAATHETQAERVTPSLSGTSQSMVVLTSPSRYAYALPYHDDTNALVVGSSLISAAEHQHPLVSLQGRSITAATAVHDNGLGDRWNTFAGHKEYAGDGTFTALFATDADDTGILGQPWVGYGALDQTIILNDVPDALAGHDWQGITFSPDIGVEGSLDGRAGTFTCPDNWPSCYLEQDEGRWYPVFTSVFVPADGGEAVELRATRSRTVATVDHLTFGYWLHVPENVTNINPVDFGLVAGGGDPFDPSAMVALSGSATYAGSAAGMYYREAAVAGDDTGSFEAAVTLTANFGTVNEAGSLHGRIHNITYEGPVSSMPTTLQLSLSAIDMAQATDLPVTGSVVAAGTSGAWRGSWAAAFFGNGLAAADHPTGIAGTFGASNNETGLAGSFGARKFQ